MIYNDIKNLIKYALHQNLLHIEDYNYAVNSLLTLLHLEDYQDNKIKKIIVDEPSTLLTPILDYAVEQKIIEVDTVLNRDLFEAKIMDTLIGRPSEVVNEFYSLYKESPQKATNYYYNLSKKSNYIKTSRTDKNVTWKSGTSYGTIDMTINLSKPEKDPLDIIASRNTKSTNYPLCLLCKENVGYSGRPGRTNHRIIPVTLNNEDFYLQYSPYVYYNEHSIVLMKDHNPMNVTDKTFRRLFDFTDQFPHYFLGSNAGLPIVGGSILSHEHYQGGSYHFPIEDAEILSTQTLNNITIKKLKWPLSVIRLESTNKEELINAATSLYTYWEQYSNPDIDIVDKTTEPHNAITPIARKEDNNYILDMALRNNRTTKNYPLGIFHPHQENHNIKKENIGLIEVMGLAVLPARLLHELPMIEDAIKNNTSLEKDNIHYNFTEDLKQIYNNEPIEEFVRKHVTIKFTKCLEDAGVFKQDENSQTHFDTFISEFIKHIS